MREMVRQSIDKDGNHYVSVHIRGQCLCIRDATLIQSLHPRQPIVHSIVLRQSHACIIGY